MRFRFLVPVVIITLALLFFFGARHFQAESSNREPEAVAILMYHKINPDRHAGGLGLRVPPDKFAWQMNYLKNHGYTVVSIDDAFSFLRGKKVLPPKPVVITFDDGYRDNYFYAWPILREYGFCATIYQVVNSTGRYNFFDAGCGRQPRCRMLNWNEIREMKASGLVTFGAHTMDHPRLTKLSAEEARRQIAASKKILERELRCRVDHFCYPYGDFNPQVTEIVKAAGFKTAVTSVQGINYKGDDPFTLKRIRVTGHYSNHEFVYRLTREFRAKPDRSVQS